MEMDIELRDAIEDLYSVFASYSAEEMEGCPHCVTSDMIARAQAKPLRKLTGNDLGRYAFKAMTTMGSIDDFKFFLPRLLELVALEGDIGDFIEAGCEAEVLAWKLQYAEWATWDSEERDAVRGFLHALWENFLTSEFDIYEVEYGWWNTAEPTPGMTLQFIANAENDMEPYLDDWLQSKSRFAIYHVAIYALNYDFYKEVHKPISWLMSDRVREHLQAFLAGNPDDPFAEPIRVAIALLK